MKPFLLQKLLSARLHLALVTLVMILQRSPAVRVLTSAKYLQGTAPVARILQSIALPAAALAAPHAVSGASTSSYKVEYINTPEIKEGVAAAITFSNTITPQSWTFEGDLPPGLRITDLRQKKDLVNGVIATGYGLIIGTPTQAGTYSFVLTPWSNPDGTGETAPEPAPGPLRLSLTVLPADSVAATPPEISFTKQEDAISLSWETAAAQGFQLKVSNDLNVWTPVSDPPINSLGQSSIRIPVTNNEVRFYRFESSATK